MTSYIQADVELTPLRESDFEHVFSLHSNVELRRLTMGYQGPINEESVRKWLTWCALEDTSRKYFAVRLVSEKKFAGYVLLSSIDSNQKTADLGILLGIRGKGVGELALRQLLKYAKEVLDLKTVNLEVFASNTRAIALYSRLGFTLNFTVAEGWGDGVASEDVCHMSLSL